MFTFGGGINPTSLQTIAAGVTQAFQGLAAQVQTTWFKQHDRHGGHKDVTATTVSADHLGLRAFQTFDATVIPSYVPLAVPRGVSFVILHTTSGVPDIDGIQQEGQQRGDVLWVSMSPTSTVSIALRRRARSIFSSATPLGTELYWPDQMDDGADTFRLVSSWVPLIYSPAWGSGALSDAWVIPAHIQP